MEILHRKHLEQWNRGWPLQQHYVKCSLSSKLPQCICVLEFPGMLNQTERVLVSSAKSHLEVQSGAPWNVVQCSLLGSKRSPCICSRVIALLFYNRARAIRAMSHTRVKLWDELNVPWQYSCQQTLVWWGLRGEEQVMKIRDIWLGSPSFRAIKLWSLLVSLLLYSQPETKSSAEAYVHAMW